MEIIDYNSQYEENLKKISELEHENYELMRKCAMYKVNFGKYKGYTLAEIAHIDRNYYRWLIKNNLLPFTMHFKIDSYVCTFEESEHTLAIASQNREMRAREPWGGRYD